jgi:hypothetical protein
MSTLHEVRVQGMGDPIGFSRRADRRHGLRQHLAAEQGLVI